MAGFFFALMKEAYWYWETKSFDDEKRTFEGIATTPSVDRMGDVIEPKGAKFTLPVAMMWQHGQHDNQDPIGWVREAKVTESGIRVKGEFAKLSEPQSLKEDLDRAWALVRSGLVRGLSIGFKPLEAEPLKKSNGLRFTSWEWLELSPVSVAANQDSMFTSFKSMADFERAALVKHSVTSVKAFDLEAQPHLGKGRGIVSLGTRQRPALAGKNLGISMTIKEQITQWEAKLVATREQADQIMQKAAEENRTLDATQQEEYDGLESQVEDITKHITRLKKHEQSMVAKATPITAAVANSPETAAALRENRSIITVKSMAPKGIGMARMAIAVANGALTHRDPMEIARRRWPDSPEIELCLKAAIEAGDTTTSGWASQLVPAAQQLENDFLELYRPLTIIGRLQGIRRVPFNISVPIETASGTAQWVGEGAPKPVTKLTLSSVTLRWAKAAAIVAITQELARFSRPDAEMTVRDSMVKTLVQFFDTHFVSATAEVTNVSPAGILNGVSSTATTGTTAAAFRTDMTTLIQKLTTNSVPLTNITLLMSSGQAVGLSLLVTDLGVPLFPNITREGGSVIGFPVIVSETVGTKIIAVNTSDILLASDPGVQVDVSREASVEMSDTPIMGDTSPTTNAVLKSAFQNNLLFIKVEQFITWKVARASAVEYLTATAYKS